MKKKIGIAILLIVIVMAILFVPMRVQCRDGGTVQYTALTYKIVSWNTFVDLPSEDESEIQSGKYVRTRVYLFPNNFKSIDELWDEELADGMDYDYVEGYN